MQRKIVQPADVSGAALTELKSWLGITRPNEDALLAELLRAGLAMCEAFTGQAPLSQTVEERVSTKLGQWPLSARPVTAFVNAEIIEQNGERSSLDPSAFDLKIDAAFDATFELFDSVAGQAVAVRTIVGMASTWDDIPAPLKQGIIRLCAFYYRDRDRTGGTKAMDTPPATVSALWRPWQKLRLT